MKGETVHVAFVDDTKQKGLRREMGYLLALGGVVFSDIRLAEYGQIHARIMREVGAPAQTELKWANPRGTWFREAGARHLSRVRELCVEAAVACEARAVVVVWDLGRTTLQDEKAEAQVLKYLYERVSMMLSRTTDPRFVLVCDKPSGGPKDEDAWIGRTLELTRFGTEYVAPEHNVLPVLTAPSHHHPHLQLADLVVGSVTSAIAGVNAGLNMMPIIKPILHTNYLGEVAGAGLKLFPVEISNLHHWALGETGYSRPSASAGVTLPWRDWAYAEDAGI